ncbi:MAG: hypothetical protein BWY74_01942 [Firmicutes bacterium ADurb.Bin419]|nr:MAG: hypothetical protein BWY74_01942 [Firmicutes bacterium ADurb.Bin419]
MLSKNDFKSAETAYRNGALSRDYFNSIKRAYRKELIKKLNRSMLLEKVRKSLKS